MADLWLSLCCDRTDVVYRRASWCGTPDFFVVTTPQNLHRRNYYYPTSLGMLGGVGDSLSSLSLWVTCRLSFLSSVALLGHPFFFPRVVHD